ncbi:hypothetical protein JNO04_07935 [Halomonas sp. MC140]|nr:hypothetical protein [Halomonas sp. MC140]MDN7132282.1 hypothetical protein [Halomonas sp. MC140]
MIAAEAGGRISASYARFLQALRIRGFDGEISPDYAIRTVLATGYSCRSQVKRFSDHILQHPLQALLA